MTRKTLAVLTGLALLVALLPFDGVFSGWGESQARDAVRAAVRAESSAKDAAEAGRRAGGQDAP